MKGERELKSQEKNEELSTQIVHEAEITRQQARYRIPAKIEIDGKIYTLRDWSVTGCAIIGLPKEYIGKYITGKMIFNFGHFVTSIENLKIECLHNNGEFTGCRFSDLTLQQLSILNQIITAYINGDIVTQDDIITAVTKIQMYPKKPKIDKIEIRKTRRILSIIFLTIFVLLTFLTYVVYKKLFIVDSINGYIDSNITVVRAPYPSYITFEKKLILGERVKKGDLLATAHLVSGGAAALLSPVKGSIIKINVKNNTFRNIGEPVVTLLDDNSSLFIKSTFLSKDLIKIRPGYIAKIIINGNTYYGKIFKITYPESIDSIKSKPTENIYVNPYNYIIVYVKPFNFNSPKFIGESVLIRVNTLVNKLGIINEKNTNSFIFNLF